MQGSNKMTDEQLGEIQITMNLIIPAWVLKSNDKEMVANFLNTKLYTDPEFFGDFGPENVRVISDDIELTGVQG